MVHRVYAVFDRVAEEAMPCFCAKNDGVAVRGFRQGMRDARRPDEYQLFYVGTFDDVKMRLVGEERPQQVEVPPEEAR